MDEKRSRKFEFLPVVTVSFNNLKKKPASGPMPIAGNIDQYQRCLSPDGLQNRLVLNG